MTALDMRLDDRTMAITGLDHAHHGLADDVAETTRAGGSRFEKIFLAAFAIAFSGLAALFPRSGDDWAWGSQIGLDRLHIFFADYNGRYAGNLAVLLLTRTPYLTPLVVGATMALIVFLVLDLAGARTPLGYGIVTPLLLAMPLGVWRESIAWLSGFTNYTLPCVGLLLFLRVAKAALQDADRRTTAWRLLGGIALGFVAQLFIEHVTLYLAFAGLVAVVAHRWLHGRVSLELVSWAVGLIAGAAAMFSNGAYRQAADPEVTRYQSIQTPGDSNALDLIRKAADTVSNDAVVQNQWLDVALVVLVGLLVAARADLVGRVRATAIIAVTGLSLALSYAVLQAGATITRLAFRGLAGVAAAALIVGLLAVAWLVVQDPARRAVLVVVCVSVPVLCAPLVVANPIGPRNFLPTYVLFLVAVAVLVAELPASSASRLRQGAVTSGLVVLSMLLVSFFVVYGVISHAAHTRLADARTEVAAGKTSVTVPELPFTSYVHNPDPVGPVWGPRYRLFYGLPNALTITVTDRQTQ